MHYSPGRLHLWHKEVKQFQPQPLEATSWKTKECSDWQYLSGACFVNCKILPLAYGSACLSYFLQSNAEHPSSGFKQLDRGLLADFAFTSAPHVQHNLQVPFPTYPLLLWWWCIMLLLVYKIVWYKSGRFFGIFVFTSILPAIFSCRRCNRWLF